MKPSTLEHNQKAGQMNQLAKWVVGTIAVSYLACVFDALLSAWFGKVPPAVVEKVVEWSFPFFGGLMAKTGYDAVTNVKAELTNDEKNPVPTVDVDAEKKQDEA